MKISISSKHNIADIYDDIIRVENALEQSNEEGLKEFSNFLLISNKDHEAIVNMKHESILKISSVLKSKKSVRDFWMNKFGRDYIPKVLQRFAQVSEDIVKNKDVDLSDYDMIMFDADKTLWNGEKGWKMVPPFKRIGENTLVDQEDRTIQLREGVKDSLIKLRAIGKEIGLISHSENIDIKEHENQPVLQLLKDFEIFDLFDGPIIVIADFPKSMFIPADKRVLFVDDDMENLIDVLLKSDADVADADKVDFEKNAGKYAPAVEEYMNEVYSKGFVNPLNGREVIIGWTKVELEPRPNSVALKSAASIKPEEGAASKILDYLTYLANKIGVELFLVAASRGDNGLSNEVSLTGWHRESKRNYIPVSERPDKPKSKGEYELDHKKPRWRGGKDSKDNLQWVDKKKHKNKSSSEGSFEYGGKDRHKKLKDQGKNNYSKYQSETAKVKVQKERESMGEEEFSRLQSERAKKRWKKK